MMRVGLFKPVHVKTLAAQEQRMLLTSRKLIQRKLRNIECDLRGTLRDFGLKVGPISPSGYDGVFGVWWRNSRRSSRSSNRC